MIINWNTKGDVRLIAKDINMEEISGNTYQFHPYKFFDYYQNDSWEMLNKENTFKHQEFKTNVLIYENDCNGYTQQIYNCKEAILIQKEYHHLRVYSFSNKTVLIPCDIDENGKIKRFYSYRCRVWISSEYDHFDIVKRKNRIICIEDVDKDNNIQHNYCEDEWKGVKVESPCILDIDEKNDYVIRIYIYGYGWIKNKYGRLYFAKSFRYTRHEYNGNKNKIYYNLNSSSCFIIDGDPYEKRPECRIFDIESNKFSYYDLW